MNPEECKLLTLFAACFAHVELTTNLSTAVVKVQMQKCTQYNQLSMDFKMPANIFFTLNTHSECNTGQLQYAEGTIAPVFSEVHSLLEIVFKSLV